ncbi:hypothetical protein I2I11_18660 [Pontibacter sp. 172403-2]|uniref:hypothetical protein n=1 Tax=Pontibacter rufus TaxID=2791028 RepID=UPI0018AFD4EF|nr:hypothetical protein [Pontibacter sp. 172403-2]MBF9255326.1 hypothetical protein [Pontibacter sp. 172403-2]
MTTKVRLIPSALFRAKTMRVCCRFILGAAFLLVAASPSFAQTDTLRNLVQHFDAYRKATLQEKVYLHHDRPFYVCGETMWFKIYTVDGTLHQPLGMSKVAYVEVLDELQKPVLQAKVALKDGTCSGSFVLPMALNSGRYSIRAYTNWMKNFNPEFYFESPVTIVNTFVPPGLPAKQDVAAYAVQFFPEGGNLIQDISSKVAFQVVDKKTGRGVAASGEIIDPDGRVVTTLQTLKFGIGNFTFTPAAASTYTALVRLPNGQVLRRPLPEVYAQGYSLHLEELNADQLKLSIAGAGQQAGPVYLLGHARQMISVAEAATFNANTTSFVVDKGKLAEGITHFTIFNSRKQPVCERLYFKRPARRLQLTAETDKKQYLARDKVMLDIQTQASASQPVAASLSLAVYRLDSLQASGATDMYTYLWLTSDLKGTIEQPEYYLTATGPQVEEATDNLMLTHGWSRFAWHDILQKQRSAYTYVPEYDGHFIKGKVTVAATGTPAPHITAYLAAPSRLIRTYNSTSDANGHIRFEVKDFYGPKEIVVQSDFRKDSIYHFEIFNPFSEKYAQQQFSPFSLPESLRQELTDRHLALQVQNTYSGKYQALFRAPATDSIAFYGKPDATYLLDDYTRFKVMEEVMREYVPGVQVRLRRDGFHYMVHDSPNERIFQDDPMVLLDGVPVFDIDKIMAFDPRKVRKLDVMTSKYFNGSQVYDGLVSYTTYQGDLAGFPLDARALLQEYEGLQQQREFYSPAYDTPLQRQSRLPDFRNLLYWSPDVLTGAGGKVAVQFYTSDLAGTYVAVVQGITKNGLAGSKVITFEVKQPL